MPNILEILRSRAVDQTDRNAVTLLVDGESVERTLTYGELDRQARAIAATLISQGARDERVLIAQPEALDFLSTFLGCLYAGAVAVPVKLPTNAKHVDSTMGIARDCTAKFIVAGGAPLERMRRLWDGVPDAPSVEWLDYDKFDVSAAGEFQFPSEEGLAYLQYTSGSTRAARGVMVSHRNLTANLDRVQESVRQTADSRSVQWLPLYHDMGLTSLLFAIHVGFPTVVMSPAQFLQRPARWLQAITRYRATLSGGPNFAYQLCTERAGPEDRASLDLSTWQTAYCGAEPVREVTYRSFIKAFGSCGFSDKTFAPCYGLAEYVAAATAQEFGDKVRFLSLDSASLRSGQVELSAASGNGKQNGKSAQNGNGSAARPTAALRPGGDGDEAAATLIADCGIAGSKEKVLIVDPETCRPCEERVLGEIWLTGPSLTHGYWNRPDENVERFAAKLHDGHGPYLRTGDLGFLHEGRLFVTGRIKDLIIIRGRNLYPQDVESALERALPFLKPNACAAFTIVVDGEERLAIAVEADRRLVLAVREAGKERSTTDAPHQNGDSTSISLNALVRQVRQEVFEEVEVPVQTVVFLKPGSFPRTSSGKVQRHVCRGGLLAGTLEVVYHWQLAGTPAKQLAEDDGAGATREQPASEPAPQGRNGHHAPAPGEAAPLHRLLQEIVVKYLPGGMRRPAEVELDTSLLSIGIDSLGAAGIALEIEKGTGRHLGPEAVYEHPTIRQLAGYLMEFPLLQTLYEPALLPARRKFITGSAISALLDPDMDPLLLELFLVNFSSFGVALTTPVEDWLIRSGKRCVEVGLVELGTALRKHAQQEAGHQLMMIHDTHALVEQWNARGMPALDAQQLLDRAAPPGSLMYQQLHEETIVSQAPFAQIAIEYEIERLPVEFGPQLLARCAATLGPTVLDALSFLTEHITLDVAHTRFNAKQMENLLRVRPDVLPHLVRAGTAALNAYARFLEDCLTLARVRRDELTQQADGLALGSPPCRLRSGPPPSSQCTTCAGPVAPASLPVAGVSPQTEVKIASRAEEWEEAFRLLATAYRARGYAAPDSGELWFTPYHALADTVVVVALAEGRVIATMSLVMDNAHLGLPIERVFSLPIERFRSEGRRVMEITSLASRSVKPGTFFQVFLEMLRLLSQYGLRQGGNVFVTSVNPMHSPFYDQVLGFNSLGPARPYPEMRGHPAEGYYLTLDLLRERAPAMYWKLLGEPVPSQALDAPRLPADLVRDFGRRSGQ